ncbi:von Willebrand factor A domain-containing protein-like [Iris pallida]|uniref:von Willebrand factor A domain-containing protein-like n=1 Tax=Iris pallida TaxID=29817 RepID=A0AAX6IAR8_IRIPA|nr:von Willebrand factor A domain-containing protein-like [Iris pallida]
MNTDPSRIFPIWPQSADDPMAFQTPRHRINWKGKKAADKRKKAAAAAAAAAAGGGGGDVAASYMPPALNDLQFQNRLKARRFYTKNNNVNSNRKFSSIRSVRSPNTTSFIIRAKKSGGIASLVSPCPVTPAILPTPKFSPSREGLVDMAKEEWGVDGYGSMKGLIRLRSGGGAGAGAEEGEDAEDGSSESDVEEHVEVERRLDHDLSRFEMVYPSLGDESGPAGYVLESRVDDQEARIAQLEEENLTMKERLFLVEREMGELRRRMQLLEAKDGNYNNNDNDNNDSNNNDNNNNEENEDSFSNNNMNAKEDAKVDNMNANEDARVENGDEVCSGMSVGEKIVGDCDVSEDSQMREG